MDLNSHAQKQLPVNVMFVCGFVCLFCCCFLLLFGGFCWLFVVVFCFCFFKTDFSFNYERTTSYLVKCNEMPVTYLWIFGFSFKLSDGLTFVVA